LQIAGLLVRLESTGSPPAWPSEEYAFTVLGNVRIRFEQWRTALSGAPLLYAYYEWDWDNLIGPLDLS
jgi:hypothetical protein